MLGASVGVLACAGYLAYDFVSGRKDANEDYSGGNYLPAYKDTTTKKTGNGTTKRASDDFPLRNGSKGPRVQELQEALSRYLGSSVFSKFTKIDGIFGNGTESALKYANFPTEIDERLFITITSQGSSSAGESLVPAQAAMKLHEYADAKNLQGILGILGQMKSTADYSAVNEPYKNLRSGLVRATIVTDLLDNVFANNTSAKTVIKAQFIRIGLRLDASTGKWSLSGLRGFMDVVTNIDTIVTDGNKNQIRVKRNTILGEVLNTQNGITYFKSIDNTIAAVPAAHVNYL
jgi:hypothetical protein